VNEDSKSSGVGGLHTKSNLFYYITLYEKKVVTSFPKFSLGFHHKFAYISELSIALRRMIHLKPVLGSGSVGSASVWLSGSGFAKICGSTIPDPRGIISTRNGKKKIYSQPNSELFKNERL